MTIKESVLNGVIPKNLRILDSHSHLGEGEMGAAYIRGLPIEKSIELAKKIGIGAMVASSLKALHVSVTAGNERMMQFTREYKGYVYASILYDPNYHDECIKQIEKYKDDEGFVGVKMHPRNTKTSIKKNDYDRLYEYCIKNNILISCHTWETEPANNPADFEHSLEKYPELKLQLCHMGGTFQGVLDSVRLCNRFPNVYLDFNGSLYTKIWFEEMLTLAPIEKFVFGTDQTFNDPAIMVGRVLLSDIDDKVKQMLLCDNFENIIGRKLIKEV